MSFFDKLLPIIAGLGITAATGGAAAPLLGAEAAGGLGGLGAAAGADALGTAAGAGAAGAAAAPIAAEAASAAPAITGLASAAPTAASVAAPSIIPAAQTVDAALPHLMDSGSFLPSLSVSAPNISPNIGSISSATPSLPEPSFADKALSYLGNHPEAGVALGAAALSNKPRPIPQMNLSPAPVSQAPQGQPLKPAGIPDRNFQQTLIANLMRR